MNYSYIVSKDGKHLFRTDWYYNWECDEMEKTLKERFPKELGFKVFRNERDNSITSVTLEN